MCWEELTLKTVSAAQHCTLVQYNMWETVFQGDAVGKQAN